VLIVVAPAQAAGGRLPRALAGAGANAAIHRPESQMLKALRNLDYVVLLCNDLESMKDFYHRVMGFPIHLQTDFWIEMRVGALLLTLSRRDRPNVGPALPADTAAVQLAFRVSPQEVQTCYEELLEAKVRIVQPPQTIDQKVHKYWKHRTLFFKDPEGNLLEIYAEIEIPA
jgi:catechol 2,3-dioxygenase-like lactoylglutathione lyase family enzyme